MINLRNISEGDKIKKIAILCHRKTPENIMIYKELKNYYEVSFIDTLNTILGITYENNINNYDLIISRIERDYLLEGLYSLKCIENVLGNTNANNSGSIKIINSSKCIETCQNKYLTYIYLKNFMPKSFLTYTDDFKNIENALKNGEFKFPLVVKPIYGGYGNGVLKINTPHELKNIFELLKLSEKEMFIQEYIPYKHDLRIFVIGDEIVCAMERIPMDDWRANYSLGAKLRRFNLDNCTNIKDIVLKSVKKVDADIVGVDVLIDKDNNPYILELNITPQFRGIMNFANIPKKILEYVKSVIQ